MTEGNCEKESNVSPLLFPLEVRERQGRKDEREGRNEVGRQAGREGGKLQLAIHTQIVPEAASYFLGFFLLFLLCKMVL